MTRVLLCCGMAGLLCMAGCDIEIEFSPWQSNVPATGLTAKHLQELTLTDTGSFEEFTIAVAADVHLDAAELGDVVDVLNDRGDIAFLLLVGDLTDGGMLKEFKWLYDTIEECDFPVLTVVGNHDGLCNGPEIYSEMFGPFNYSFVYRGVQFIMWNNNPYEWGDPDLEWLEQQVENHAPSVVVAHQPLQAGHLPSSKDDDREHVPRDGRVIAAVHGHTHKFDHYLEDDSLPVYLVAAVHGGQYGLIEFTDCRLRFFNCSLVSCEEVTE
jgi:predicted phosphodiesterase